MFERFTERARQVVVLAQEEARTLKHNYIGTEHILLGLLRQGNGVAVQVLRHLDVDVDLDGMRGRVIDILRGRAVSAVSEPTLTTTAAPAPPICGRCHASLTEFAGYRIVDAAGEEEDAPVRFVVIYCRACGTALGTAS